MIIAGVGTGSYDIDTTRLDLGAGNTTIWVLLKLM